MSVEESEASSKDTQIGNKEQQEQTTRSGLVVEEEDQEDHLGRVDRKDVAVHAASLVVDHATSLADQAATMTMTMMTAVMDQVDRAVGSSDHKAPIQREPTRPQRRRPQRRKPLPPPSQQVLGQIPTPARCYKKR